MRLRVPEGPAPDRSGVRVEAQRAASAPAARASAAKPGSAPAPDLLARARRRPSVLDVVARGSGSGLAASPASSVQRLGTITVHHVDYNPDTGRYKDQDILMDRFAPALVEFVTNNLNAIVPPAAGGAARRVQDALRLRVTQEANDTDNWRDRQGADLESLATRIVRQLLRNPGGGVVVAAALRPGVLNALRHGLPFRASDVRGTPVAERTGLTTNEVAAVDAVLDASAVKSSAKGTPNQVAAASLNAALAGLGDAVQAIRDLIVARNTLLLGRMGTELDLIDVGALGAEAGKGLGIRSMHQNGAGWLPGSAGAKVALPTTLAAQRLLIRNAYDGIYTGARRTAIETLPAAAQDLTRRAIWRTVTGQAINALPQRTRILLIWSSYAANQGKAINYVEFNLASRINRIMYDYVNSRFFITAHYNWFKGYNPFFEVTGLTDI